MALESTTTDPASPAADEPQLDEQDEQTVAETQDEDTSQVEDLEEAGSDETEETQDESGNSEDAELEAWAASKNLPLDDPMKIAKMYRDAEKQLGKQGQREGQLKKAVDTANTEAGVESNQALENRIAALEFYLEHPDAKPFEAEMVRILEEKPWLAGDLEVVLDAARGRSTTDAATRAAERKLGRQEALAQAEKAGRAAPPRASATNPSLNSSRITPDNVDAVIGRHMGDTKWYAAHIDEINAALAG